MQSLSFKSWNFARCVVCDKERRFLAIGDEALLFGNPGLCVRCYFGYVRSRARISGDFEDVSPKEVQSMADLIMAGHFQSSEKETRKSRRIRLLALQQLEPFAFADNVRLVIADDLRMPSERLFPSGHQETGMHDERKDTIITLVRAAQARRDEEIRASLLAKALLLVLGAIIVFALYSAWK